MPEKPRIVIDTNVLVSRLLSRQSIAAQAVEQAMSVSQLIISSDTIQELDIVLSRPKFAPYITAIDRQQFTHLLRRTAFHVDHVSLLTICRDPKDDKFLALAVAGNAGMILSGDNDLLALHPFRGIKVLSPRQYLDQVPQ